VVARYVNKGSIMALTKITSTNIGANAVTNTAIGYTPANKAGDTFTGNVGVGGTASGLGGTVLHVEAASNYPELVLNRTSTGARKWGALVGNDSAFLIRDYTSGLNNIVIDTSGRVTMPYQPTFHYNNAAAVSNDVVKFASAVTNVGNNYSTSTGRFTAPVAGIYYFFSMLMSNAGSGRFLMWIRKNGTSICQGGGDSTNFGSWSAAAILSLAASDYVEVYTSGTMYGSGGAEMYFMGRMLG